jgi:hypothetical protein
MDIQLVQVLVHVDEDLDDSRKSELEEGLRALDGVVSTRFTKPHLLCVEYNPEHATSAEILSRVTSRGLHAELIGL